MTMLRADGGGAERRDAWRVAALYLALTIVLAYPLSIHPATEILGGGADPFQNIWILSWDAHAFVHQPFGIFDPPIYSPIPNTLAYAENLIGSAILAAPIIWLSHNPLLGLNLVALLSIPLGGFGAWLLARRVGLGRAAAVIAGLIFAFAPPRFLRLEQFQLTTIQWIPFCLAFLHSYLDTGRRRDVQWAIGFFTLQAITSGQGTVFLLLGVVLLLAYRFALGEPLALVRRARDVGIAGLLLVVPAIAVFLHYRRAQTEAGLVRDLVAWDTAVSSFFASPSHVDAYLASFLPAALRENPDVYLFPGIITLVLVAAAWLVPARSASAAHVTPAPTWAARRRRDPRLLYTIVTLICVWLVLGPPWGVWQYVYRWPGLSMIRVPTRFSLLAILSLGILAGIGFDRLSARIAARSRVWLAAALGLLLVGEFASMPLGTRPYPLEIPAIDRWLNTRPKPFVVAEFPMHDADNLTIRERQNVYYMLYATAHWQPTVHGYSAVSPPDHEALYVSLANFPDDDSLRRLASFHVTYVLVHLYDIDPSEHARLLAKIAHYKDWLTLEHAEGLGRVYSLHVQ